MTLDQDCFCFYFSFWHKFPLCTFSIFQSCSQKYQSFETLLGRKEGEKEDGGDVKQAEVNRVGGVGYRLFGDSRCTSAIKVQLHQLRNVFNLKPRIFDSYLSLQHSF